MKRVLAYGLIWAVLIFGAESASTKSIDRTVSKKIDLVEVDRRIKKLMDRPGMVGLAVAIVEDGEVVMTKGYGTAVAGRHDPVTKDTVFRWASLSKGVAAAALLKLSSEGKIGLQSPVAEYAPSLKMPDANYDVTIEDILSHRTGITSNAYDNWIEAGKPAKMVRASLNKTERQCEPGACYTYQNVAFDSVAEAAETVTGLPYKAIVNEAVFAPLEMTTASLTLEGLEQSAHWARPHGRYGQAFANVKPTYYRLPAAAGVNSSIEDLARWMSAQMDETSVLGNEVLQSMHTPRIETPYEDRKMRRHYPVLKEARYGLGWRIYDYDGRKVIGHRGAVQGYRASILFDPDMKTGVAVLWNSNYSRPAGLPLEIFDQVYGKPKRDWMRLR